jgi:hypothetical protein
MSTDQGMEYKVGVVGPTRVGKTTLITAVLEDAPSLLQGTGVQLKPADAPTKARCDRNSNELTGTLAAAQKRFSAGNLRGNEESFVYRLVLTPGDCDFDIRFNILDYPGGWIDEERRPPNRSDDWRACQQWFNESSVLMVPIDASVAMEASEGSHRAARPFILTIAQVVQIAREWGIERKRRHHEPATLLLCPVKCESYFADNGGLRNDAASLSSTVRSLYQPLIEAVKGEAPHAKIVYSPIDTIGCIELIEAHWQHDASVPGSMDFTAEYLVRKPYRRQVKGADTVLISLLKEFMAMEQNAKTEDAIKKRREAEKDHGFFGNAWRWWTGQLAIDRTNANAALRRVEDLKNAIGKLGSRAYGSRVEHI